MGLSTRTFEDMSSGVTIILPDGSVRVLGGDATGADLAADLGGEPQKRL